MSAPPRVSVVIPTHDRLPLLRQAIESVRSQTLEDWELIVVDDGSTDETVSFVRALADPRVRILAERRTGNVAWLRNTGARVAAGRYIAFLDSDDLWLPDKLRLQLERMDGEAAFWSYTRYEHVDEEGRIVPARAGASLMLEGDIALDVIEARVAIAIPTLMLRSALFFELGGFDEDPLNLREDYDFEIRLALRAPAIALPESLVRVREHEGRTTNSLLGAAPFLATARVYDKLLASLNDAKLRRAARRRRAWHLAEAGARRFEEGDRAEGIRLLLRALADRPPSRHWLSAATRPLRHRSSDRASLTTSHARK